MRLKQLYNEIDSYSNYNLNKGVEERLEKTLKLYLEELDRSYTRLKIKDADLMMRRLSKNED